MGCPLGKVKVTACEWHIVKAQVLAGILCPTVTCPHILMSTTTTATCFDYLESNKTGKVFALVSN